MPLVVAWKNQLVEKVQEQGGVFCVSLNNPVNIRCLQDTLWIHFHHPYIWQHFDVAPLSWPQYLLKYVGHHIMCYNKYLSTNSSMEDHYEFHMTCGQSFNLSGVSTCQIAIYM